MTTEYEFHKKEYSLMPITNVAMDYRGKKKKKKKHGQKFVPREQSESLLK